MSFSATVHQVMIASPGDVGSERNLVREVLQEWNAVNAEHRNTVLLPLGWEVNVAPEMGDAPQSIINKRILGDADLLVGIFWTRLGTPTKEYQSGSVEEIEEHLAAGKPAMLYFSSAPVMPDSIDLTQYQALKAFRTSCQSRGVYEVYASLTDFREKFSRQLQLVMGDTPFADAGDMRAPATAKPSATNASLTPAEQANQLSNEAKELLKTAGGGGGVITRVAYGSGVSIEAGDRRFTEAFDARSVAVWEGVIEELEAARLIKSGDPTREVLELSHRGFTVADAISA